jgi:hypothetical protein
MVKDYLQALETHLQGPWKRPLLTLLHAYLTTPKEDLHTIRWQLYNLIDRAKKTDGYGTALLLDTLIAGFRQAVKNEGGEP